ncbi:MAG: NlpC/P60 family protein [Fibrobacter sp.]|nr:NlpC/P60 family protein [Fibrobacter sp.]
MTNFKKKSESADSLRTFCGFSKKLTFFLLLAIYSVLFISCTFPVRTGYDRKIGDYKPVPSEQNSPEQTAQAVQSSEPQQARTNIATTAKKDTAKAVRQNSPAKARAAINQKEVARSAPKKSTSLESAINPWLGTRYKLGGTSKSGIDCSGYVMVIYKDVYGISLPHNAATIYKDDRGSSVSRGSLKEGDLVFFGDFWGISHIGIYLNGDRFTHASTSKGVMISPMNDKYWSPKYKGARRFR